MPLQTYTVSYSLASTPGTIVDLTNVVSFNMKQGREKQLDEYSADTAQVVIRYPNGYASPITALVPGNIIRVKHDGSGEYIYAGYISGVSVNYGIPYSGGVGNADFINISCESYFARFGRLEGNSQAITGGLFAAVASDIAFYSGLTINPQANALTQSASASTVTNTYGEWLSQYIRTINGRMAQGAAVIVYGPGDIVASSASFSDTANNATNQVYDNIEFSAFGDNYYTQVTVTPTVPAAQTVTSGAGPYRSLKFNTFSSSTTTALNLANFMLSQYSTTDVQISSISCLSEAQTSFKLNNLGVPTALLIGMQVPIKFRGTTYYGIIEGFTMTATPESSRWTYYISGASLNSTLILDDAVFGKLGTGKLGY
jgi:hypothetical protein